MPLKTLLWVCLCVGVSEGAGAGGGGGERGGGGEGGGGEDRCDGRGLAAYRLELKTSWGPDMFPKQYPEWRPPAQWSKVVGRSHNASYQLFSEGQVATEGVKQFAETGESSVIEREKQEGLGVLDQFTAPPVPRGVGDTSAQLFVDGNHSRVSLISRVVPSPDWFIGIDNFNLCHEGSWRESVVIEVDPLDAGTDNGFTFTSPNWPTIPRKPITRITAQSPNHPANSFFYPDRERHPPIAVIRLFKIKEYSLTKVFIPAIATPEHFARNSGRRRPRPNHRNTGVQEETRVETEEPGQNTTQGNAGETENGILAPNEVGGSGGMSAEQGEEEAGSNSGGIKTLLNTIVTKYKKKYRRNRRGRKSGQRRQGGGRRRRVGNRRRMRAPRDCRVTEWAEWSPCSKTCGIGEQVRTRAVLRQSRRGGRACPSLQETTWCGSYRDCNLPHFAW